MKDRPLSTAEKLIQARAQVEASQEKVIENIEQYQMALNGIAATEYGEHVLKVFVKALGVFTAKPGRDGVTLVEDAARRAFYFSFIRQHLNPELRQKIES